mmetsp:Transcript_14352/g.50376  ORF Transcript_14352/g.50376 Transcript_14352/m.50376 type:complete len:144 (+) Transcript_14352:245-676(+)
MFCHGDYRNSRWAKRHLASNLFGLYIFGRAVEEQSGSFGVVFAYVFCGLFANLASKLLLHGAYTSLGASGAVFGLFVAAALTKLAPDWRSLIECGVLGQFALSQVWGELAGPSRAGVNKTAHLAGAVAGVVAWWLVRRRRTNT